MGIKNKKPDSSDCNQYSGHEYYTTMGESKDGTF
nr:MAG TPA: hypothetical protein [Caudoviricetes sp.]DAW90592.1 MAG TPA: hypothetical protein [Bacteriophage sp.]